MDALLEPPSLEQALLESPSLELATPSGTINWVNWSPTLRALIFSSCLSITVVGVLGNTLVWYGSVFRAAIKMEQISRVLITNLALTDVILTLSMYPAFGLSIGAGWIPGQGLCVAQGVITLTAISVEIYLMMTINCYRLWVVQKATGDRGRLKVWHVYVYLGLLLLGSAGVAVLHYQAGGVKVQYAGRCLLQRGHYHKNIIILGYWLPPLIISFIAGKTLKCILWRTSRRAGTENAKTHTALCLVCLAMLVSYLPSYVIMVLEIAGVHVPDWVYIARFYVIAVNLLVNPAIYFAYNSSFNEFVRRAFKFNWLCFGGASLRRSARQAGGAHHRLVQ